MKNVLCFGDSNTYGYIPGGIGRYEINERWTGLLQARLAGNNVRIIEEGLCGRTTVFDDSIRNGRNGSRIFSTILESHNPLDLIIIMLGTNDCKKIFNANEKTIAKGIEILIEQAKNKASNAKVLVVSPIHLGERVFEDEFDIDFSRESVNVSKKLSKEYSKVANNNGAYFIAASDYAIPSEIDQEHLSLEGHEQLATAFEKKIKEILEL